MFTHPFYKDIHPLMIEKTSSIDSSSMMYRPNQKLLIVIRTSFYIICPISYISWLLFLLGLMDVIQSKVSLQHTVLIYFDLWFVGEPYESAFSKDNLH
jgi:hypothetical protein